MGRRKVLSKVTQCEWWRHDLNSGSQVPEDLDPGHYFVTLAHESLPLASRSAIGTLMWRSVFGGTSEGLMHYCQTCSSCWGPWRTARPQSARRSWRKCKARWVSRGPLRTPWGGCCGQQGENGPPTQMGVATARMSDFHRPAGRWRALRGWMVHMDMVDEEGGL